ncbi:MAG: MerR family transcriptional regulator, partial [Candidatus Omnitrophica bacterium CG11_big_fil_rev_8_21_14_0_20_41_12]
MKNPIMTTRELANYIKLNEKTIIRMAQNGKIPGVKVGSQWR